MKITKRILVTTIIIATLSVGSFAYTPRPPSIKLKNPPELENPKSSSIVLLGDPQSYGKHFCTQPLFELLTAWTCANKENLNIQAVLCTGDLVERNETATKYTQQREKDNGDQTSEEMWTFVSRAFSRLDGELPYVVCTGNHDYGYESAENRDTRFNEYFPVSKNKLWRKVLIGTFPNSAREASLENAAYRFDIPNWGKVMVISLEFAPRDEVLEWAKNLAAQPEFKDDKVIILTHSILGAGRDGVKILENEMYKLTPRNWGANILKKLVRDSENIKLALCGHSGDETTMAARIEYEKANGARIPVVMFNPQAVGGWHGNGGDGWLRIMEFMPDGKTIKTRTYSPLFAISDQTQHLSWKKGDAHEFELVLE